MLPCCSMCLTVRKEVVEELLCLLACSAFSESLVFLIEIRQIGQEKGQLLGTLPITQRACPCVCLEQPLGALGDRSKKGLQQMAACGVVVLAVMQAEPFPLVMSELMSWICFHPQRWLLGPGCFNCAAELPRTEGICCA